MTDMEQRLKSFKNCLQKEVPHCVSACPFHLDVLEFIEKIKRGSFKSAYKTYRNAVGFPQIAHALCPQPCQGVCPGKETSGAIELGLLEKACLDVAGETIPTDYNLPLKKKKIAVIGAGISGLACALRLCTKKYEVVIFEREECFGGRLWEVIPQTDFVAEIERQFAHEQYTIRFGEEIKSPAEIMEQGFDAVYVATGKNGLDFGLLTAVTENGDSNCKKIENTGWFAGGELVGDEPIQAMANGLFMGTTIDNFLKTGNLLNPGNEQQTNICLNAAALQFAAPVQAANGQAYTPEEAIREAARCVECQCDACRRYCDLTGFFNKWPMRIRDEILSTTLPGSSEVKATPAKRLLSTCNQCGLCKETCPQDLDLGGLILEGRKSMHQQKKAPWVFHDFWLRDMDFSNDKAALCRTPQGYERCEYVFFPGCQLGAGEPELVKKSYAALLHKKQDTGIWLQCCGVPAEWAGDEEKHQSALQQIREKWNRLGKPTLILACPTCEKKFKTYLPDIPVTSIYEVWEAWNLQTAVNCADGRAYAVFDPCAARQEESMKAVVRTLAKKAGFALEPLPDNDQYARCCSYGGQGLIANPPYAEYVVQKRINESENPYISYCINCRDIFRAQGKETLHILEILTNEDHKERARADQSGPAKGEKQHLPTVTERRENRLQLKRALLAEYWGETMEEKKVEYAVKVTIGADLKEKLNKERIFEDDITAIVDFCERTGRKTYDPEKGTYSGYREVGFMTCWVEYQPTKEQNTFALINAYAHRMKIELEAVWNGRKTEVDL